MRIFLAGVLIVIAGFQPSLAQWQFVSKPLAGGYPLAYDICSTVDSSGDLLLASGTNFLKLDAQTGLWEPFVINAAFVNPLPTLLLTLPNGDILFSFTGSAVNYGIYRSRDRGESWTRDSSEGAPRASAIVWNARGIFLAIGGGTGGGAYLRGPLDSVWRIAHGFASDSGLSYVAALQDGSFIGVHGRGIYKSTDDGKTWFESDKGLHSDSYVFPSALVVAANGDVLTVSYSVCYRSNDEGATWSLVHAVIANNLGNFDRLPNGDLIVTSQSSGVFRSKDNGGHWYPLLGFWGNSASDVLAKGRDTLFGISRTAGIFESTDRGGAWEPVDTGVSYIPIDNIATHDGALYLGLHNRGVLQSNDNALSWQFANAGLFEDQYSLTSRGSDLYAFGVGLGGSGVGYIFRRNRASWQLLPNVIDTPRITTVCVSANGTLFESTTQSGVYSLQPGDTSWRLVYDLFSYKIQSIACDSAGTLYAMGADSLFWSTNDGASWKSIQIPVPDTTPISMTVNHDTLCILTAHEIYRVYHHGIAWLRQPLDPGITNPLGLAFHDGITFCYTRTQVFESADEASSWTLDFGIHSRSISCLTVMGDKAFVGTRDSGVFWRPLQHYDAPPPNESVHQALGTGADIAVTFYAEGTDRSLLLLAPNGGELEIFNMMGARMMEQQIPSGRSRCTLFALPSGSYFARLRSETGMAIAHFAIVN